MDRVADHFVNYLFDEYQGTRHVRRVAAWLGLILKGIERAGVDAVEFHRSRQLLFTYRDQRFKARYNHQIGGRGGIEILMVLPGRGLPDGPVVIQAGDLVQAEEVYLRLRPLMDRCIEKRVSGVSTPE